MIFREIGDPHANHCKLFSSRAPHRGNEYDSTTKQGWNFITKTSRGWNEKSFPRDTLNWVRYLFVLSDWGKASLEAEWWSVHNSKGSSHPCNPMTHLWAVHYVCVPAGGWHGLLLCDSNEKYTHWGIFFFGSLPLFLPEDKEDRYNYL